MVSFAASDARSLLPCSRKHHDGAQVEVEGRRSSMTAGSRGEPADRRVHELAARQHGVVTSAQLQGAGVSRRMIQRRAETGRYVRMHRGVYRVGPVAAPRAGEIAAVLAVGRGACLSHRSAASLWGLLPRNPRGEEPEVLVARRGVRQPSGGGYLLRHTGSLPDRDRTARFKIPVTAPERTVVDLAAQATGVGYGPTHRRAVTRRDLEQAIATAHRKRRLSLDGLRARIEAAPGRAGTRILREMLEIERGPSFTRSEAEQQLTELIRRAGIPAPEPNVWVEGYELDLFWRRERLAVEVDGYEFHRGRSPFEGDRARDSVLAARGIQVARFTARRIAEDPLVVIAELGQVLGRRAQERGV
ncbi:MAG: DUF559 domain-containing protein [Gemmatimonadales bacterium]|nr:MAG: DUF559 domain-containing protein [Gemmatimonadales bacterium]